MEEVGAQIELARAAADAQDATVSGTVAHLASWMTGSFSSQTQAEADGENYFDIRLEMVRIWPERDDGVWLYVEQAAARALDRPYRQRIYRLVDAGGMTLRSEVYEFAEPLSMAGAWRTPERFAEVAFETLVAREGCAITLCYFAEQGAYAGFTQGTGCSSSLSGASYATSQAWITADGLVTWDRGWTAEHEQAWGAEKAGYVFERVGE
jgi:hypothetical protein